MPHSIELVAPQLQAAREKVDDTRERARTAFDEAKRVMNRELASL